MAATYIDLNRAPDLIRVQTENGFQSLQHANGDRWSGNDAEVTAQPGAEGLRVLLTARVPVKRLHLRWRGAPVSNALYLGDQWERAYGDLAWRPCAPERAMPWYFLCHDGALTHGYGVYAGANALCFWQADGDGVSLWADLHSGGVGVQLGERELHVCDVLCRRGGPHETPYGALCALCRQMSPHPRLPDHPVYGSNDWYYAYGNNTAARLLEDAKRTVSWSPAGDNRPYTVVDDGWDGGRWDRGNERFPSMPGLAHDMRAAGARPGIWIRPLIATNDNLPDAWRQTRDHDLLDPTRPEVLHKVAEDVERLHIWGYQLIKHDFSTVDVLGRWGFEMGATPVRDGWSFADRSRTNAEIVLELYRVIRKAAGDSILIGCNTVSHLSAGFFELCRIGDDTSGREWERTRKMGINCLAFRAAQHGTLYDVDADCVGLTEQVSWELNRQWLDLLARSGTPLFVSAKPEAVGPEQTRALTAAFTLAAQKQPVAEPLDWLQTTCPAHWKLHATEVRYDWYAPEGATPFGV
jgi:alpha-galactosidase